MQQQEQQTTGIQKTTIRFYLIREGKGDIIFAKIKILMWLRMQVVTC